MRSLKFLFLEVKFLVVNFLVRLVFINITQQLFGLIHIFSALIYFCIR